MSRPNSVIASVAGPNMMGDPLYALYLPPLDLFLIVYHQPKILYQLRNLLSSKCATCMIAISDCPDYYHTMIDNTVCHNWTIKSHHLIEFMDWIGSDQSTGISGRDLGLIEKPLRSSINLQDLQNFAQESLRILIALDGIQADLKSYLQRSINQTLVLNKLAREIMDFFPDAVALDMKDQPEKNWDDFNQSIKHSVKSCFEIIYWAKTVDQLHDNLAQSNDALIQAMIQ